MAFPHAAAVDPPLAVAVAWAHPQTDTAAAFPPHTAPAAAAAGVQTAPLRYQMDSRFELHGR